MAKETRGTAKTDSLPVSRGWFDRGTAALARVRPEARGYYACPLCLIGFDASELDRLTVEHVPPHSMGGTRTVLTCDNCNHKQGGSKVDAELSKFVEYKRFLQRRPGSTRKAKVKIGGTTANVIVGWKHSEGGAALEITNWPKLNSPTVSSSVTSTLESGVETGVMDGFTLELSAHKSGWPEIGLLRAAYLVAFAKFGYRFIAREVYDDVRRQIDEPQVQVLQGFHFLAPSDQEGVTTIALITAPAWAQAFMVQFGRHRIFLPIWDDDDLYNRMGQARAEKRKSDFQGRLLAWPRKPEYMFDLWPAEIRELHSIFGRSLPS
jgi:hypothetical protein